MKLIAKLIVAGAVVGAAGSVAAGSTGKSAGYAPVPGVNRNSAIPRKNPLLDRPALAPKSKAAARKAGGSGAAAGEQAPRFGVERAAPERQVPDAPVAAAAVNRSEGNETQ